MEAMPTTYLYPSTGPVKSRVKPSWTRLRAVLHTKVRESRRGMGYGAIAGLGMAILLSLYATVVAIARGSAWLAPYYMWLWQIVGLYVVGCVVAGTAAGVLAPFVRWRLGAVVAGVIGVSILYATVALAMGFSSVEAAKFSALMGVAVGGPVGFLTHYREAREYSATPGIELLRARPLQALVRRPINMRRSLCVVAAALLVGGIPDLQAQVAPFDPVTVSRTSGAACYRHALYIVVERARQEVGSDLFVRPASSRRCDPDSLPGDFVWRNREAEYFLGLRGHVLFIDSGTGPDLRGLILIDLGSRRRLLETTYVGDIVAGPDSLTVGLWRGSELSKPAPGCPPTGMIPGIDSLFWLDLRAGRIAFAKQTRCAERQ